MAYYAGDDYRGAGDGSFEEEDEYDFFPHWFPDATIEKMQNYLNKRMPVFESTTPDMPELNRHQYHDVFVYGTLKRGGGNNRYLCNAKHLGKAWTKVRCLELYTTKTGLPVVFYSSSSTGKAVQGELYRCTPASIRMLDGLESNGSLYKRRKILVESEYNDIQLPAYMYFGMHDAFATDQLTLVNSYKRTKNNVEYYSYPVNAYSKVT